MRARISAIAALSLVASACLFEPANESLVATPAAVIAFAGETAIRQARVELQAGPARTGPFTALATLTADTNGRFRNTRAIPAELWSPVCGGGFETFVRALVLGDPLDTFDDARLTGESGQACVVREATTGNLAGSLRACRSDDTPVARIASVQPHGAVTEIKGDLAIDDPKDAGALFCLRRIDGSLLVEDGVLADLALPALEVVTGDVTLAFDRPRVVTTTAESLDLPRLATIGGSLFVRSGPPGEIVTLDVGLPALTSLGADLSIEVDAFNVTLRGIAALAAIPGDLRYDTEVADSSGFGFLSALREIDGALEMRLGTTTTQAFLPALERVGGNASISRGTWVPDSNFEALTEVGGSLRLTEILVFPPRTSFGALEHVGGTLDYDAMHTDVVRVGAAALAVGGLRLNDDDWLTDLDASLARVELSATGPIAITNNANLRQCDALDWVAALPGYTGTATVSGNQPCP